MSSYRARPPRRRASRFLARPADLVEQTRQLFYVLTLLSLALTAPAGLTTGGPWTWSLLGVSCLALAAAWTHRYRSQTASVTLDGAEAMAMTAFALACPMPAVAFSVVFPALWFRAMYGHSWHVGGYVTGLCGGLVAATLAWGSVPGHSATTASGAVFGTLPVLLLTFVGARHLAAGLFAREETRRRDAVLAGLGTALLGLTDPLEIGRHVDRAAEEVCRLTPELRAVLVEDEGRDRPLRVVAQWGRFAHRLTELPRDLLRAGGARSGSHADLDPTLLAEAAGLSREWLLLPLPAPGRALVLGAPDTVSGEVLTVIRSLYNQEALALRVSDAYRDLQVQARIDALTGLLNRAAFTAALDDAAQAGDGGSWVIFLDLDDFKVVNDGLGHAAGDQLLAVLASRLVAALRDGDVCGRLGGDEFGILLRSAEEGEARQIGQRLIGLLSAPVHLHGHRLQVGASVGLAPLLRGIDGAEVVQQADIAMYAAKADGKNRLQTFHHGLLTANPTAALEAELRTAVDQGQFTVVYQPIVSTADGRCTAAEALVRWVHPTRGLVPPDQFLDVAERSGVIIGIGEQVLRQACADAAAWRDRGEAVALHVNASPSQLAHPRFVTVVRECLQRYGFGPKQLVVEITETTVLDSLAVQATLDVLAQLGVGLAVDDFGTGYSALTTLRTLPVDVVKIDKSFVAGAATKVADHVVLEAIAQMADRLGLETVAEGVEDIDQQRFVQQAGISAAQGYLHSRPVPAGELTAWLESREAGRLVPALAGGHRPAAPMSSR